MKPATLVMLDACVLLPMPLADTLLRMAEHPCLYLPKWSDETLRELSRNLTGKWSKSPAQAKRREDALRSAFPEALVEGYEVLLPSIKNDPKDRHVLAAAIKSGTRLIISYNGRHFPQQLLEPLRIQCQGPSTFLIELYRLERGLVLQKLTEQAQNIGVSLPELLRKLQVNVPGFVAFFCAEQQIDL